MRLELEVMNVSRGTAVKLPTALATCGLAAIALFGAVGQLAETAIAQQTTLAAGQSLFQKEEVNGDDFVVMAAPRGLSGDYFLMIVEQQTDDRACWQERGNAPVEVDALLLTFDFTRICGRKSDSNAYSVRMADVDLGLNYSLRVVPEGEELFLRAYSNLDFNAPPIEIGRTNGISETGYTRILFEPGWRLTRRVYDGRALGHIYITSDSPLEQTQSVTSSSVR